MHLIQWIECQKTEPKISIVSTLYLVLKMIFFRSYDTYLRSRYKRATESISCTENGKYTSVFITLQMSKFHIVEFWLNVDCLCKKIDEKCSLSVCMLLYMYSFVCYYSQFIRMSGVLYIVQSVRVYRVSSTFICLRKWFDFNLIVCVLMHLNKWSNSWL